MNKKEKAVEISENTKAAEAEEKAAEEKAEVKTPEKSEAKTPEKAEPEKPEKIRYKVDGKGIFARLAAICMLLSMGFRLMGYWGFWNKQTAFFCYMQILLPIVCGILFIVILLYLGKKSFWLTVIPVCLGAVFFIVKSADFDGFFKTVLCIVVSVLTAIVYTSVIFGKAKSKWLLVPVFGLPLLYQLIIRDGATFLAREGAMTLNEFIPELSVLLILLSLLLTVFAMKKRKPDDETAFETEDLTNPDGEKPEEKKENETASVEEK